MKHDSDCAIHNEPALPYGACDCTAAANELICLVREHRDAAERLSHLRQFCPPTDAVKTETAILQLAVARYDVEIAALVDSMSAVRLVTIANMLKGKPE